MIVVGASNPFDGITLYGPFEGFDEANEWAEHNITDQDWWSVEVQSIGEAPEA